ncbi:MAG: hypothetical protein AB8I08_05380 [Sandaracinaceae bacterium]
MLSTTKRQRGIAAIVTVAGALGILTLSVVQRQGEDEAGSRRWVGEQWDVARECLVGTPIGRGDSEAAIAERMEVELYGALLEAALAEAPDPHSLWPARCVPRLAGLHRERAMFRQDPDAALAQLEVLAPRLLRPEGAVPYAVGDRREQLRELASAVAELDAAMPFGAEYAAEDFPTPTLDPAQVVASMACRVSPTRRPFLEEGVLDALEGEVSWRLTEDDGRFTRTISGPVGTRDVELERLGTQPRFMNLDGDVAWLDAESQELVMGEDRHTIGPGSVRRFAPCFFDGRTPQLVWATDTGVAWSSWSEDAVPSPPHPVEPTPPLAGTQVACSNEELVLAWFEDGRWQVVRCADDACRALGLEAHGDLQLAAGPAGVLALSTTPGSDLTMVRIASDDTWSEPRVGLRGRLRSVPGGYALDTCSGSLRSEDGILWLAPAP